MELKVKSNDLLTILVDTGIDEIDAKAIIFDIIQIQNAPTEERQSLIQARKEREATRRNPKPRKTAPVYENQIQEDDDEEEAEEEETPRPTKRVNFSNFGGDAPGLSK